MLVNMMTINQKKCLTFSVCRLRFCSVYFVEKTFALLDSFVRFRFPSEGIFAGVLVCFPGEWVSFYDKKCQVGPFTLYETYFALGEASRNRSLGTTPQFLPVCVLTRQVVAIPSTVNCPMLGFLG